MEFKELILNWLSNATGVTAGFKQPTEQQLPYIYFGNATSQLQFRNEIVEADLIVFSKNLQETLNVCASIRQATWDQDAYRASPYGFSSITANKGFDYVDQELFNDAHAHMIRVEFARNAPV